MTYSNYHFTDSSWRNPPPIDVQKFTAAIRQIDQATLERIVAMARHSGISDNEICQGLEYIKQIRK